MKWHVGRKEDTESVISFLSKHCAATLSERLRRHDITSRSIRHHRFFLLRNEDALRSLVYRGQSGFYYPLAIHDVPDTAIRDLRRQIGGFSRVYSVMGIGADVNRLDTILRACTTHAVDYRLMRLSHGNFPEPATPPLRGLEITSIGTKDWRKLLPLQMAYNKEEVLLPGRTVNVQMCRSVLLDSLASQRVITAARGGEIVARVATNAIGYRCEQIGGVYVIPELRNCGIARWLMKELLNRLAEDHKDATLFVKPSNEAAIRLYEVLGFRIEADFRINYYGQQ